MNKYLRLFSGNKLKLKFYPVKLCLWLSVSWIIWETISLYIPGFNGESSIRIFGFFSFLYLSINGVAFLLKRTKLWLVINVLDLFLLLMTVVSLILIILLMNFGTNISEGDSAYIRGGTLIFFYFLLALILNNIDICNIRKIVLLDNWLVLLLNLLRLLLKVVLTFFLTMKWTSFFSWGMGEVQVLLIPLAIFLLAITFFIDFILSCLYYFSRKNNLLYTRILPIITFCIILGVLSVIIITRQISLLKELSVRAMLPSIGFDFWNKSINWTELMVCGAAILFLTNLDLRMRDDSFIQSSITLNQ